MNKIKFIFIKFLNSNKLTRLLLFLMSSTFNDEFKKSINSKIKFYENNLKGNIFLIRRNIHRIEKGLINPKPKATFALSYIEETIESLNQLILSSDYKYESDINYAVSIISIFFKTIELDTKTRLLKKKFETYTKSINIDNEIKPYELVELENHKNDCNNCFDSLVKLRRSVRYYEEKCVDLSAIHKAVDDAKNSPSPCNRNSTFYHVISNKKLILEVGSIVGGTKSFVDNIPLLIAITSKRSAFFGLYDRNATYIDASLSAMTFIYSLQNQGLSSCCINWPRIPAKDKLASKLLHFEEGEQIIMLLSVGFGLKNGLIPFSNKPSSEALMRVYE